MDVYANTIGQLAGMAGFTGHGLETVIKLAFMTRLPQQHLSGIATRTRHRRFADMGGVLTRDIDEDTVAAMQLTQNEFEVPLEMNPQTGITCYI